MRALWKYVFLHQSSLYIQKKSHPAVLGEKKKKCGHFRPIYFINANCQIQHVSQAEKQGAGKEERIQGKHSAGPAFALPLAGNQK